MASLLLTCSGLSKTFVYNPHTLFQDVLLRRKTIEAITIRTLENVSLAVQQGEWVGLSGPNGTGKTTLLRMIAGLLPPDTGTIVCRGSLSAFLGLGVGFEQEHTAEKNVYLHQILRGMSVAESKRSIEPILAFAGLQTYRNLPLKRYSTGMQLRLGYAAAALTQADLYLFDEVFAVGDQEFRQRCVQHMHSLRQQGKAVILVGHSLPDLHEWCDRVMVLKDGCLTEHFAQHPQRSVA